jgi:hypothetical protein
MKCKEGRMEEREEKGRKKARGIKACLIMLKYDEVI